MAQQRVKRELITEQSNPCNMISIYLKSIISILFEKCHSDNCGWQTTFLVPIRIQFMRWSNMTHNNLINIIESERENVKIVPDFLFDILCRRI